MTETNVVPVINVNLRPCRCQEPKKRAAPCDEGHRPECGGPILIPCPIPCSVTVEVRLGQCECRNVVASGVAMRGHHHHSCPARPVRVACSISGETWEKSQIESVTDGTPHFPPKALRDACRERWALIKALVTGSACPDPLDLAGRMDVADLFTQRDTVFAALADMARAERGHMAAMRAVLGAGLPESWQVTVGKMCPPDTSVAVLARYVEHLIEQVDSL